MVFVAVGAAGFSLHRYVVAENAETVVRRSLAAGRIDEASNAVERWLSSSPQSAAAHYFKAKIAWLRDDLATVDDELGHARTLGYAWAPLGRLRGLLLFQVKRTSEAEPFLREAFDTVQGTDPEVAEALAHIYLATFRLSEAALVLDEWMRRRRMTPAPICSELKLTHGATRIPRQLSRVSRGN